jgi:multiple sugar transport system substrate-binding protein
MSTFRSRGLVAAALVPLLIVTACGDDDEPPAEDDAAEGEEEPAEEPAEEIHLTLNDEAVAPEPVAVWIEEYVIPTFEQMMADEGKNVTVEHVASGTEDYKTQLALDLSVGEGADITQFDQFWTAEFAAGGLISPLSEVVGPEADEWEGWSQIPEAVQSSLAIDGEQYGIPSGTDGRVIYFNKDLFGQAGLPEDWQPTSWDEVLDAARTLQAELPDVTAMQLNAGTSMGEATTLQGFIPILLGAGGDVYADGAWQGDTPELREALELYATVFGEGLADADMQLLADGRDQSFQAFAEGELGMLIEGDFLWRGVISEGGNFPIDSREDVVGWALIPAQEPGAGIRGQDFVSASGGTGYVINPNTDHPQEAWALLSFIGSLDAQSERVTREPRITGRNDVNEFGIADDPLLSFIAADVLPLTWYRPGFEEYPLVSEAIQLMVENLVAGRSSVDEAAQQFQSDLEGIVGADNVAGG